MLKVYLTDGTPIASICVQAGASLPGQASAQRPKPFLSTLGAVNIEAGLPEVVLPGPGLTLQEREELEQLRQRATDLANKLRLAL